MDLCDTLPTDELLLARLASAKLAKVMHGLLTVGIAALEGDSAADFLAGRDRTPLGFLEVLRCIGVKPGHADQIATLRDQVRILIALTEQVHGSLRELAHWRTLSPTDIQNAVERVEHGYALWCERLDEFRAQLGMKEDHAAQVEECRVLLRAVFQTAPAA